VNLQSYIDIGWSVFPIKGPAYGVNYDDSKSPFAGTSWKPYQFRKPTTSEIAQWQKEHPKMSIGAVAGPISGFFVIDIDGQEWVNHFPDADFGITWKSRSKHGCHYFYQWEDWMLSIPTTNARVGGLEGFDIRGQGGYAIVPNDNDPARTWEVAPLTTALAPLPEWIKAFLLKVSGRQARKDKKLIPYAEISKDNKNRHTAFLSYAGKLHRARFSPEEIIQTLMPIAKSCEFESDLVKLVADLTRRYPLPDAETAVSAEQQAARFEEMKDHTRQWMAQMPSISSLAMKLHPAIIESLFLKMDAYDKMAVEWTKTTQPWLESSACLVSSEVLSLANEVC
jgi:hypothetical protein